MCYWILTIFANYCGNLNKPFLTQNTQYCKPTFYVLKLQFNLQNANWQQGLCLGQHIIAQSSYTQDECLYDCKNHLNCNYATFDSKNKICHLNSGCSKVVKFADAKYEFTKKDSRFKGLKNTLGEN